MNGTFDGENAFKHLERLAVDIGSRETGSVKEREAAEYIASHFRSLGLKTHLQEFEIRTAEAVVQRLEVLEPYPKKVGCTAYLLAGDTGPEGVEGELVYMDSLSEEYVTPDIDGKIIITSGFFCKGMELFKRYRPKAIINIGRSPRMPVSYMWGAAKVKEKYGPMPTLNVTFEDGLELLESGAKRVRVTVVTDERDSMSQNVIGELEGSEKPDEIVVVGGHYDTVPNIPGASDNAGGIAVVMELARVFNERGSRRTMRFVAWAGEEMMLLGSRHDVLRLREEDEKLKKDDPEAFSELDKLRLIVNVDVQGARIGTNMAATLGPPELKASVMLLSKVEGVAFSMSSTGGAVRDNVYSSDSASYSSVGVPCVSFVRFGRTPLHSVEDSVRWLDPEALRTQGAFIETFMATYVSDSRVFPFERTIPDEHKKALERYYEGFLSKPPSQEKL